MSHIRKLIKDIGNEAVEASERMIRLELVKHKQAEVSRRMDVEIEDTLGGKTPESEQKEKKEESREKKLASEKEWKKIWEVSTKIPRYEIKKKPEEELRRRLRRN